MGQVLGLDDFINEKWMMEWDRWQGKVVTRKKCCEFESCGPTSGQIQETFQYKALETRQKVLIVFTLSHSAITYHDGFVKRHCG